MLGLRKRRQMMINDFLPERHAREIDMGKMIVGFHYPVSLKEILLYNL